MTYKLLFGLTATAFVVAGCQTVPEPEPEAAPIRVEVEPLRTCTPIIELTRRVIPAEYVTRTKISYVESPPEYVTDPVTGEVSEYIPKSEEVATPYEVLVKEEEVYYVNEAGIVVTDICPEEKIMQDVAIP